MPKLIKKTENNEKTCTPTHRKTITNGNRKKIQNKNWILSYFTR